MARKKTSHPPAIKVALIVIFLLIVAITAVGVSQMSSSYKSRAAGIDDPLAPTCAPGARGCDRYTPTPIPSVKRVFVTSTTYNGNLGGLSGADLKCQTRADAANLGGTWKAWLSDSTTSATSRLNHFGGQYQSVNGIVVASNWNDLTDGILTNPINKTEFGNLNQNYAVWTHTATNGEINLNHPNYHCQNWTYSGTAAWGDEGYSTSQISAYWTETTTSTRCDNAGLGPHALYCFEQ